MHQPLPDAALQPVDSTPVQLFDVKRQQAFIRDDIETYFAAVLNHGQFILGPEVEKLEGELAVRVGVRHAITVSSGRDALVMALIAYRIGPGDAVLVPAFTFAATAAAVVSVGARPIFVDVAPDTGNLDATALEQTIARLGRAGETRIRAIIAVDLYGLPADCRAITQIAEAHNLVVIVDAAQSFGGFCGGVPVGKLAPITATSFYPTKTLGAYGDGGALLTNDDGIGHTIKAIRTHGRDGSGDEATHIGMTGRLDTLQAAVLLSKLPRLDGELARRRAIAEEYTAALSDIVTVPCEPDGFMSAWLLYTIQVPDRDGLREKLTHAGIETGVFYRQPLHMHAAFAPWSAGKGSMPVAESLADRVLSLPIHSYLTDEETQRVIRSVRAAMNGHGLARLERERDGAEA